VVVLAEADEGCQLEAAESETKVATTSAAAVAESEPIYAAGSKLGVVDSVVPEDEWNSDHEGAAGSADVAVCHLA
jgi:hypothetical protein